MLKKIISFLFIAFMLILFVQAKNNSQIIVLNEGVTNLSFLTELEIEVIKELNLARTNPQIYAGFIEDMRKYYDGKYLKMPNRITLVTNEGLRAVDEAIRYLKNQKPIDPFKASKGLSLAAKNQVNYQGPRGAVGHSGKNNSSPFDRMNYYGQWQVTAGENIDYGNNIAREIVIALIVDDGVSSRGHRKNIYNNDFKVVGVGCGIHKVYRHMCVMDFAGQYAEKK